MAYQIADLIFCAQQDSGTPLRELRVAGGPTRNEYLMQFESDILGCPVVVARHEELSGIGSAYMAGLAMGLYDHDALRRINASTIFTPQMSQPRRQACLSGWKHAVETVLHY